jgi:hypothetical protein
MLFKTVLLASAPLAALAFVAPVARSPMTPRGRHLSMSYGYENGARPVGGVQFFPDSEPFWVRHVSSCVLCSRPSRRARAASRPGPC